jgi:hypothetical protein
LCILILCNIFLSLFTSKHLPPTTNLPTLTSHRYFFFFFGFADLAKLRPLSLGVFQSLLALMATSIRAHKTVLCPGILCSVFFLPSAFYCVCGWMSCTINLHRPLGPVLPVQIPSLYPPVRAQTRSDQELAGHTST